MTRVGLPSGWNIRAPITTAFNCSLTNRLYREHWKRLFFGSPGKSSEFAEQAEQTPVPTHKGRWWIS